MKKLKTIYCVFNLNFFSIELTSSTNPLSFPNFCSICVQLCNTVLWSRFPISFPMREAGIFVCFWARYMESCLACTISFFLLFPETSVGLTLRCSQTCSTISSTVSGLLLSFTERLMMLSASPMLMSLL